MYYMCCYVELKIIISVFNHNPETSIESPPVYKHPSIKHIVVLITDNNQVILPSTLPTDTLPTDKGVI